MRLRRLSALGATLGLLAAGLATGTTAATAGPLATSAATASTAVAAAATSTTAQTVDVFVRRDGTVVMPTELRAGLTRFRITSRRMAGFQLAQAEAGYTKRAAMRDINAGFMRNNMRAMARFEENMRLLGGMPSDRDRPAVMLVHLEPGSYWALDSMPDMVDPAKVLSFTVTGDAGSADLPGQVIRATGTAAWGKMSPRIKRRGVIEFQNPSDAPHFIVISKLARGKTMRDVRRYFNTGAEGPPPVNFAVSIDSGIISAGESMSFRYRLPAGKYVMTCWWPMTDMGGMPHALMGMYRGLRVG